MVGIDLVQISRVEKLLEKKNFLTKVFTKIENDYFIKKNMSIQTIAGIFAVKEAVSKAFGVGIGKDLGFKDIEVYHDEKNCPKINVSNEKIHQLMSSRGYNNISISISHDGGMAVAIAFLK